MEQPLTISVLCFSKNRPLQLEGYLRSLFRFCDAAPQVCVLYTCHPPFERAYQQLVEQFPAVRFVREGDFFLQVCEEVEGATTPFFMFGCDDVFFYQPWSSREVAGAFEGRPGLLGFSLRLGREIHHCHPMGKDIPQPHFADGDLLQWSWREADGDWAVPFELDATVYSIEWVRLVMAALPRRGRRPSAPNYLENSGFQVARDDPELQRFVHLAARPRPSAKCLTVNRVQEIAPHPIYGGPGLSAVELLERFESGWRLDVDRYLDQEYDRIHIGDAFFRRLPE